MLDEDIILWILICMTRMFRLICRHRQQYRISILRASTQISSLVFSFKKRIYEETLRQSFECMVNDKKGIQHFEVSKYKRKMIHTQLKYSQGQTYDYKS